MTDTAPSESPEPQTALADTRPESEDVPGPSGAPSPRARAGLWVGVGVGTAAVAAGLLVALSAVTAYVDAQRDLFVARQLSAVEQTIVTDALTASGETAGQVDAQRTAYREAAANWQSAEQSVRAWRADPQTPSVERPNPGGDSIPGGNERARGFLDGIGAGNVQLIFDAGPQNCGYSSAGGGANILAMGGCYNSRFEDWLFLAWDSGIGESDIWPVFVHEAMHWYQWEHFSEEFESAAIAGIQPDAYRAAIESDASCRAVYLHGIARSAFEGSSAPCDVDDWNDGWLVAQLAALGAPVAAPDPETFEVQAVTRP